MLGWIFKKKPEPSPRADAPKPAAAPAKAPAKAGTVEKPARKAPADPTPWQDRLNAALGNDAALLDVARQAGTIDVKCAAIEALADEASLKQAEREFRSHDRRVHRLAKQRFEAAVAQRQARARADELIASAMALLEEATIPTNRLVELDRAWQALDAARLDEAQKTRFAGLSTRLTELTRERGEREQQLRRWSADANHALKALKNVVAERAAGQSEPAALTAAAATAAALASNVPDDPSANALKESLQDAVQLASQVGARVEFLASLQWLPESDSSLRLEDGAAQSHDHGSPGDGTEASTPAAHTATDATTNAPGHAGSETPSGTTSQASPQTVVQTAPHTPAGHWQALPPVADPRLAELLNRRFVEWQAARTSRRAAAPKPERPLAAAPKPAATPVRGDLIAPLLAQAEAALESGNLAQTQARLAAIDAAIGSGEVPKAMQARLHAVQAEVGRLRGWQHWGGGRARDDLVQEAQTLAAATIAALADPQQAAKLPVKPLADAIDDLRKRWKDLDRLGGATNQTLWHSFDTALKTAFEPVAAHLEQLKARRQQNLEVRNALIDTLDGVAAPSGAPAAAEGDDIEPASATTSDTSTSADGKVASAASAPATKEAAHPSGTAAGGNADPAMAQHADWKEVARALDHFNAEWRKLGPVEHTVPRKAVDKLMARMQASVARLEAPLKQARQVAQSDREQMVVDAKALAEQATRDPQSRELIPRVRELQERWQQHARALPLTRQVENALWAAFKAATDAVFSQRDAATHARDTAMATHLATREALLAQLEALDGQTPEAEIRRTLASVDTEWRQAGEVPRQHAARLDARLQAAHQAALQLLSGSALRAWQARCDGLSARLALCDDLEGALASANASSRLADLQARWAALGPLPGPWEAPVAARWQRGCEAAQTAWPATSAVVSAAISAVKPAAVSTETATGTATEATAETAGVTAATALAASLPETSAPPPVAVASGALDAVMLQLEAALDVPSPPAFQAARRDMKLRAMKAALEGRTAAHTAPASVDDLMAAALSHPGPDAVQRDRLADVIDALRRRGPNPAAARA